ncbi:MAG: MBL fold metallo-hydrolase [Theionarchaea archaeon]|nr:MBL fold metallo-hydrolase [Theionarchaea archaeon]
MIRVPTPFRVGDVNIYVIGDTLIDTGAKTPEALDVIKRIDFSLIKNIVLTHGHVDHHGLASYIRNISHSRVFVHEKDLQAVSNYKNYLNKNLENYRDFLEKTGIPKGLIKGFEYYYGDFERYGDNCEAEPFKNEIETSEGVLKIFHTPGHTPGSCCFLLKKILYSGDTLLPHISTNPSVQALIDEGCGLKAFQESLATLLNLDLEEVYPGHGSVIQDYRGRIQEILHEHAERRQKVIMCLSEDSQSLVEITQKIFGIVPASEVILALAECFDHIRTLENEGIAEILEEEKYYIKLKS